ncbi:CTD small phosphatase-like protein 3 [Leptodactylus fuscus]
MILRSRKIPARPPRETNTPRKVAESFNVLTPQSTSKGQRKVQLKSAVVHNVSTQENRVTPSSKKHTIQKDHRLQDYLEDEALQTPHKPRSIRVHFQLDDSPEDASISSPLVCLYSPPISRSGEEIFFLLDGYSPPHYTEMHQNRIPDCPYFSHLPEDDGEDFNPSKLISSAQATSGNLRQWKNEIPFKTRSAPESTLVLDLEVLVESSLILQPDAEFTFLTPFQDTYYKVYLKLRPHVREFLHTLCKIYEIFVFTTAKKEYAEKILEILDPQKKLIRHRLYQNHCFCVLGHYVKDLNVLHRDLAKTVALNTVAYTLPFHLTNRIPIRRWSGNQTDEELLILLPVLEQMTHVDDVRVVISHQFQVDELAAS